ncbi:MAG TPA: efflux RND transporter periplasmic adaptor subunit [Phycisphaerales bacterium]|nr:efflux RND transporter periplasmic adaptor subunit [Phycisphaerales bacterium]
MWKWFLAVFIVLVGLCGGGAYWMHTSGKFEELRTQFMPGAKPVVVRIEKVSRGDLVRTVSAPGLTEPKTKVAISAQVSARIIGLPFREGQDVKAGDVLVRLDARDLQANLDSAKAQLKSEEASLEGAKASLASAESELIRRRNLYETKDISKAELDTAEEAYLRAESAKNMAEFSIEIARANITRAEKDLDNAVITAPFDGTVVKLNAEVGELVVVGTLNNAGSVIMEMADLSTMLIKAKVDEANVAPVKPGQNAKVFFNAFDEEKFDATVERVRLQRQQDTDGTAYFETELLVHVPQGRRLMWGLTANCDIEVERIRDAVKVPSQAILDRQIDELPLQIRENNPNVDLTKKFARVVYQFKDGKAVTIPVRIGPSDLTHTVILAGLEPGTEVVTGPFKQLVGLKEAAVIEDESKRPAKDGKPAATAGGTPAETAKPAG